MQILVEYQAWIQSQPELQGAPALSPGYVAIPAKDFSAFDEVIDVAEVIEPYYSSEL